MDNHIRVALADDHPGVRRHAVRLVEKQFNAWTETSFRFLLMDDDPDPTVVEVAAWACGEHERVDDATLDRLIALTIGADEPMVRESAAAALGAIGDRRGLPAILHAVEDKPNVRRRAVLALAPFDGPEVDAAIEHALGDRDWQVRQAAEDLRRATGELDLTVVDRADGLVTTARTSIRHDGGQFHASPGALYRLQGEDLHFYVEGFARIELPAGPVEFGSLRAFGRHRTGGHHRTRRGESRAVSEPRQRWICRDRFAFADPSARVRTRGW